MKNNIYTFFYALIMGTVCAGLLGAVGGYTAPYKKANARAETIRNILSVFGVGFDRAASPDDLIALYRKRVDVVERETGLRYNLKNESDPSRTAAIAIPLEGPGLWGPIKGFLSLEPDGVTIRGITFHEQEETPGLGGEIAAPWFRDTFVGKSIVGPDGKPGFLIKSGSNASNAVDGITGATLTCDKVQAMLNQAISVFRQEGGRS